MSAIVIRMYLEVVVLVVVTIAYIIVSIKRKGKIFLKIVIGIFLAFIFCVFILPALLDIPNLVNGNYCIVKGEVKSWNYSDEQKVKERGISIIDTNTQKEVRVTVQWVGIHKGEYLEVEYLPNSKYGMVKKKY